MWTYKVFELAERNKEFAEGLGYGMTSAFLDLNSNWKQEVLELAERNKEFAEGLCKNMFWLGVNETSKDESLKQRLIKLAEEC